jgi:hypothetical protein
MRPVIPLALLAFAFSASVLRAQNVVPSFPSANGGSHLSSPVALPETFSVFAGGQGDLYVLPPMQMVPPVAPPGYTPIPRGDLGPPGPMDRVLSNPFAQATEAGGQATRTFNENFDGDFAGVFYTRRITVLTTGPQVVGTTQQVVGFNPVTTTMTTTTSTTTISPNARIITITNNNNTTNTTTNVPIIVNQPIVAQSIIAQQQLVRLTLATRYSGVLITDNDNPRPQDRVYGGYNFYDNIGRGQNPGLPQFDLQRQMVGFEKTFLDGDASFGMRLPFVQMYGGGPGVSGTHDVGDLSLIGKYAIINDRNTGNLWSAGFVLTTPTGSGDAFLFDGTKAPHSVLFQPWTGFVRTFNRGYAQGITSFLVPSDHRDPTLWNNSVAVGYYIYQNNDNRWLNAVVPTVEVHVRTPLSKRDPNGSVFLQDQVNLTGGVHFRLFNRATFSPAVCVPVVGPRPWNLEAMAFLNWYY